MAVSLSPRRLVGLGALVVVAALVGFYLIFFSGDDEPEFTLDATNEVPAANLTAAEVAGTYSPTSESQVGYRVREKLGPAPAMNDAVGRTNELTGTVVLEADGDSVKVTETTLEVAVNTLVSDKDKRDNKIRTIGLQTDTFPKASFKSTQPIAVPASALTGTPATVNAVGDLTIHGQTKSVTIPLQVQLKGEAIQIVGNLTFPWSDFGMEKPNVAGFVSVESDPTLEMNLILAKAG